MLREWRTRTWLRLKGLMKRKQLDRDLDDELQFHVARRVEKLGVSGSAPDQAQSVSLRQFGNSSSLKEAMREMWAFTSLENLWQDIHFGLRMLRKNPGFTAVAILTLALGIGANTAIFSVVNAVLLRPLPFRDPAGIMAVLETKPSQGLDWLYVTPVNYVEWQRRTDVFENIAATQGCGYRLADDSEPHLVQGSCASSSFFSMLGVQPIMGRLWSAEEDLPGNDHEAVVSYEFWKGQFGGDPNIIGKTIWRTSDREVFAIIGVLPPDFQFASEDISVWTPLGLNPNEPPYRFHSLLVFARLKPGTSMAQAQSSMTGIANQLEKEFPSSNTGWGITVQPIQQFYSNLGSTRSTLFVLLGAVGCLLLIACANVANLLLARATVRQREVAVRVALGASRLRLIRQLLTESLLLGLLGGAAGFLLARAAFGSLMSITPRIPSFQPHAIRIDAGVFIFTMAASLVASVFFGLTPAMRVSKQDLNTTMREAGRGLNGTARDKTARHLLVISEIGFAVMLLIGAGLLVESFRNLQKDHLGFTSDHVLTVGICCLDEKHFPTQKQIDSFYRQLFDQLRALPGVQAASMTTALPTRQFDGAGSVFQIQGRPPAAPGHETVSDFRVIDQDYFRAMEIPSEQGRVFTNQDDDDHVPVAVINETMARRYWPDQSAIGQQIQLKNSAPNARWFNVVGVVANSRDRGLGKETRCTIYLSNLQMAWARGGTLLIRTKPTPQALAARVRDAVRSLNRDISIGNARTLDEVLDQSLSPQKFSVTLLTMFAAMALCLASIGVYGVTAFTVAQRSHEIGVRIALGAQSRDILLLIVGQGARLAFAGSAAGLIGALALTRLMSSLLFGVSARDPFTLILVCATLTCVTLLACLIPARRAMRVDPMVALRHD